MSLDEELLARIDERVKRIHDRQLEEISERHRLSVRIENLEAWRNFLGGAWAFVVILVAWFGFLAKSAVAALSYGKNQ